MVNNEEKILEILLQMQQGQREMHDDLGIVHKELGNVHKEIEGLHGEIEGLHGEIEGLHFMYLAQIIAHFRLLVPQTSELSADVSLLVPQASKLSADVGNGSGIRFP